MYPMSVFFRNLCKISVKKFTRVYGFRTMIHSLSASMKSSAMTGIYPNLTVRRVFIDNFNVIDYGK